MQTPIEMKELNLSRQQLTDAQLQQQLNEIGAIAHIKRLDLSFNQLTDESINALADLAEQGTTIDYLDLTGNQKLSNHCLNKLPALKLKELHINHTQIDGQGLTPFLESSHILHIGSDRRTWQQNNANMAVKLEQHLQQNRTQFRTNLIMGLIVVAQAHQQKNSLISTLPKPLLVTILLMASQDYCHAYFYSDDTLTPRRAAIDVVIDGLKHIKANTKAPQQSTSLFFQACQALNAPGQQTAPFVSAQKEQEQEQEVEQRPSKRCVIC